MDETSKFVSPMLRHLLTIHWPEEIFIWK